MKTQTVKTILTFLALFATSVVTVATSKKTDSPDYVVEEAEPTKNYLVASNCPGAVPQARITITNKNLVSPSNINFFAFGLPTSQMSVSSTLQIEALVNGQERTCLRSEIVDQGTPLTVFTCSENGSVSCQITFELVQ